MDFFGVALVLQSGRLKRPPLEQTTENSDEDQMRECNTAHLEAADDTQIVALFRKWADAIRSYGAADDTAAADRLYAAVDEARRNIADIPTTSAVGLAVKAYLLIHLNADLWREDIAALPGYCEWYSDYPDAYLAKSMLRDMVRIVPELAPLAANFIK